METECSLFSVCCFLSLLLLFISLSFFLGSSFYSDSLIIWLFPVSVVVKMLFGGKTRKSNNIAAIKYYTYRGIIVLLVRFTLLTHFPSLTPSV